MFLNFVLMFTDPVKIPNVQPHSTAQHSTAQRSTAEHSTHTHNRNALISVKVTLF